MYTMRHILKFICLGYYKLFHGGWLRKEIWGVRFQRNQLNEIGVFECIQSGRHVVMTHSMK